MFKRIFIVVLTIATCCCISCNKKDEPSGGGGGSQEEQKQIVLATMGASLMYPKNGWVEKACEQQNIQCLNKAVSSKTVTHFAQQLWGNTYATEEELKKIDILLIQFANAGNIYGDSAAMLPTADDYTRNYTTFSEELFHEYSYAQRMDYIMKKWQQICEQYDKPMYVIFVTHWHDGRVVYNEAIRKLTQRWNADLCELDKNIGFTKDEPLPDGRQPSILYAVDTEFIDSVEFGWHPLRGDEGEEIQTRMARILEENLKRYKSLNK